MMEKPGMLDNYLSVLTIVAGLIIGYILAGLALVAFGTWIASWIS